MSSSGKPKREEKEGELLKERTEKENERQEKEREREEKEKEKKELEKQKPQKEYTKKTKKQLKDAEKKRESWEIKIKEKKRTVSKAFPQIQEIINNTKIDYQSLIHLAKEVQNCSEEIKYTLSHLNPNDDHFLCDDCEKCLDGLRVWFERYVKAVVCLEHLIKGSRQCDQNLFTLAREIRKFLDGSINVQVISTLENLTSSLLNIYDKYSLNLACIQSSLKSRKWQHDYGIKNGKGFKECIDVVQVKTQEFIEIVQSVWEAKNFASFCRLVDKCNKKIQFLEKLIMHTSFLYHHGLLFDETEHQNRILKNIADHCENKGIDKQVLRQLCQEAQTHGLLLQMDFSKFESSSNDYFVNEVLIRVTQEVVQLYSNQPDCIESSVLQVYKDIVLLTERDLINLIADSWWNNSIFPANPPQLKPLTDHLLLSIRTECTVTASQRLSNFCLSQLKTLQQSIGSEVKFIKIPDFLREIDSFKKIVKRLEVLVVSFAEIKKNHDFEQQMEMIEQIHSACGIACTHVATLLKNFPENDLSKSFCSVLKEISSIIGDSSDTAVFREACRFLNFVIIELIRTGGLNDEKNIMEHEKQENSFTKQACVYEIEFFVVVQCSVFKLTSDPAVYLSSSPSSPVSFQKDFPMKVDRSLSTKEYYVMTRKLYFDLDVKGQQLLYKYSIFCPHLDESSEYILYGKYDLKDNYRMLRFKWDTKVLKMQQFDGCLYPIEYEEEGLLKTFAKKFLLTTRAVRIPDTSNELNICFDAYAHSVIVRLERCEISDWQSLIDNYNTILSVFDSFVSAEKLPNDFKASTIKFFDHRDCRKIFTEQLMMVVTNQRRYQPEKVFTFFFLARVFEEMIPMKNTHQLLELLPSDMQYTNEYEMITSSMDSTLQADKGQINVFLDCMNKITAKGMVVGKFQNPSWVYAHPFRTFFCFQDHLQPFSKIIFSQKVLEDYFEKLAPGFKDVKVEKEGALKIVLTKINLDVLSADPLLGFAFFFICHENEYSLLIEHIPVLIVLSGIQWRLSSLENHSQDLIQQVYLSIFSVHRQVTKSEFFPYEPEVVIHIPKSVASLASSLLEALQKRRIQNKHSSEFEECLSKCIQIISVVEERYLHDASCSCLSEIAGTVEKWAKELYRQKIHVSVKTVTQEQEFWKRIDKFVTQTKWQEIVHKTVRSRLNQMSFRDKVEIFRILITSNKQETEEDVFMDELENSIDLEIESADVKELELMMTDSNMKSVRLICNLMEKKYASKGIDLKGIFSWDLWPKILEAYCKDSRKFGEKSKTLCEEVKTLMFQIFDSVSAKESSSLSDLEYYTKNEQPLYNLLKVMDLNVDAFKSSFDSLKEVSKICFYYYELCSYFCTNFSDVLKGTPVMQKYDSIRNQLRKIPINQLCTLENEKYSFPCLEQFALPTDMVVHFAILSSSNLQNDLFYKQWKHLIKSLDQAITVQEIYDDVWIPLFHYCEELVNQLRNKKITLKQLESLFGGNDEAVNCKEISRLTSALSLCSKFSADNFKCTSRWIMFNQNKVSCVESSIRLDKEDEIWISDLSKQISRWTSFKGFFSVANLVTTILKNLEVNPVSFAEVEIFSSEDLQNTTLCSLSLQTECALEFLKECSSQQNDGHLEAIRDLSESKELVKWIRTKSEDYHEMQRFIEVTMDTVSEEGDVVQDRLSDLQDLCGKFSKILYQFDKSSCSIDYVVNVFQESFKSLKAMKNPLATVRSCRANIVWYSKVEQLQGSVELGTKTQLEDINSSGVYHIEVNEATYMTELYLKVKEKRISIDDLLELESKLILITRPNSSWNDEKNKFQSMLAGVMKTKQRIQKLKEYGYLGKLEEKSLLCNKYSSDRMDKMADNYEQTLVDWISYVWTCRQKYYQLNFYTTQQLVTLRHELTKIKTSSVDNLEVNPIVFNLLQSVTGKEEYSTMLLRKAFDEDTEDANEKDRCEDHKESTPTVERSDESESSVESTKIQKAIEELTEKQVQLYNDVKKDYCHHPDFLILESIHKVEDSEEYDVFTIGTLADEMSIDMDDDEDFAASMSMKWGLSTSNQNLTLGFDTQQSIEDSWKNEEIVEDDTPLDADLSTIVTAFIPFKNSKFAPSSRQLPDTNCFISLEELGCFLKNIVRKRGLIEIQRSMERKYIEDGYPNLLVVPPGDVYLTILKIYAEDKTEPLPGFEEVLLCSTETLLEEVVVFWMRALYDNQTGRLYCLVHGEKLPYLVAEKAIDILKVLQRQRKSFRLIILCSNEGEDKSHIISCLHANRRQFDTITDDDKQDLRKYLNQHIKQKITDLSSDNPLSALDVYASSIDQDSSRIRIVLSEQCGVGKSLYVRRLKDKLQNLLFQKKLDPNKVLPIITVPLHGPVVMTEDLLQILFQQIALSQGKLETKSTLEHVKNNYKSTIIHLDIPEKVLPTMDDILFSLLILKGLSDTNGRIWRCLNTQLYVVEVNQPSDQSHIVNRPEVQRIMSLLELLPSVTCVRPSEVLQQRNDGIVKIDAVEVQTPMYQRVFQYLKKLDSTDSLETFVYYGILDDHYSDEECLKTILRHIRLKNPTWKEIRHFVWFFNVQLSSCENSSMLNSVKGLKSFVVKFLKTMSTDFATSAMTTTGENLLELHLLKRAWGNNPEPYIFFNIDRRSITHTGLGVSNDRLQNKPMLVNLSTKLKIDIETENEVYSFLKKRAEVPFFSSLSSVQHDNVPEALLVQRLAQFMGLKSPETVTKPDETYVLTNDNFVKIIGLQMRFRCQIPVVLMGETGCGKTHLIRFMCKFAAHGKDLKNMFILKVHGGTKEKDVIDCLKDAMAAAEKNRLHKVQTVVFFDEANTSEVISLIKEIMCDGRCNGEPFPPFLKFVAACNPYRSHSEEMRKRLASAGLGWRSDESTEKLGDIPLRDLVYRVHDLPPSMRALVYDFGALPEDKEKEYIIQIVKTRAKLLRTALPEEMIYAIANVLCECQNYMRARNDECSFVSLRDIERVIVVFIYFCEVFIPKFDLKSEVETLHGSIESLSLILAVGVCYHAKMEKRSNFEDALCKAFRPPLPVLRPSLMSDVLKRCQEALLVHMTIQDNIAKNKALRENIFMMFVCIELRIPLFLVGKPGSSKSLAKTIIQSSMKGENSKTPIMQEFKQVHMHSHQCSPMSTPSSITEVFISAKKFQMKKNTSSFVSVVVLDEVGLAEASPYLPLKALHPLLEDGVEGSGSDDHRVDREERVAFIGISNWALDPAKMNRGIMVTRGDPGIDDLIESATGICSNIKSSHGEDVLPNLEMYFKPLAHAYSDICKKQEREFFGLRDFYSLIKMLCWMVQKSRTHLTTAQVEHAIKRNFSGYENHVLNPYEIFMSALKMKILPHYQAGDTATMKLLKNSNHVCLKSSDTDNLIVCQNGALFFFPNYSKNAEFIVHVNEDRSIIFESFAEKGCWISFNSEKQLTIVNSKVQAKKLFSLEHEEGKVSFCTDVSVSEFVELLTYDSFCIEVTDNSDVNPNNTDLELIKASLFTTEVGHGESRYLLFLTENFSAITTLKHFVLTSFEDSSKNQTNKSINEELSKPYVLFGSSFPKDSEYAQVCRNISKIRLCMESGQMVILLNLENLYESLYDVLNQYYMESGGHRYVDLGLRAHRMKCRVHRNFKLILIAEKMKVYEDFPTPLINRLEKHFITSNTVLKEWQKVVCSELQIWINATFSNKDGFEIENSFVGYNADTSAAVTLQASLDLSSTISSVEGSQLWNKEILERCQKILLQLATPDAVIRAQELTNQNWLSQVYFEEQEHSSLSAVIKHYSSSKKALIHVTTHSPMLLQDEIEEFRQDLQIKHLERYHLESFQTEIEFLEVINEGFSEDNDFKSHIILECDSGHLNGDLVSCCRYRVLDKYNSPESNNCVIVLLIHIPRKYASSNFVSFQSKPWNCLHIDHLMESPISLTDFVVKKKSLSELFYEERADQSSLELQRSDKCFCDQLDKCIHSAVSLVPSSSKQRLISILKNFIGSEQSSSTVKDKGVFNALIIQCIANHLQKHEKLDASTLINFEANNFKQLQNAGTLVNAIVKSFERTVVPVFAGVISYVDQFCNLDILDKQKSDFTELWLTVFESADLCQSKFSITAKEDQAHKDHEKAKFPFSWLIYNFICSRSSTGVALFHDSELERVLEIIPPHSVDDLLRSYIHDFAFLAHRSVNAAGHKLLECSVLEMSKESFGEAKPSLLSAIVSVHHHYNTKKEYFDWFLKLVSYVPQSILNSLEKQAKIEDLITIVLVKVVESKSNDLTIIVNKGIDAIGTWLQKQYEMEQVITLILRKFCHQDQQIIQKWQWICAKRNFVESVVMKNKSNMSHFSKILDHYSKQHGELQDVATMNKVAIFLCTVENYLKKQGSSLMSDDQRRGIHRSCWEFFISVLSKFCFDSDRLPDKRLIDPLITSLFNNSEKKPKSAIDKFMAFHKEKVDDLSSIFVKLLLNYRYDDIEVFLEDILKQACTDVNQYPSLCTTIISCLRDYTCAAPGDADQWILPDRDALLQESVNSPNFLFAVAQCWSCIYKIVNVVGSTPEEIIENQSMTFYFDSVKRILTNAGVNDEMKTNAPMRFLIRLMVRLHGASWFLTQVEVHKTLDWMIPDEDLKQDSNTFLDIGAVYNPTYDKIRAAVSTVITSEGDLSQLREETKTLNPQGAVSLALAFYEKVRLRLTSGGLPSTTFSDKVIQKFVEFSEQYKYFCDSSEVLETVRSIIENTQSSCFSKMQVSKRSGEILKDFEADHCDVVRALVIHSVLSICLNGKEELIQFLNLILKDPAQLKDSYFPCMPLTIPHLLTNGQGFPSCEDGHKNSITMIGQHCHLCTKLIKESRAGMPSVIEPQPPPCFKFGYIPRTFGTPFVVGKLTCSSSSIIRVIFHSCLLWAACNNKDVSKLYDHLQPDYLWQEIEADLESLRHSIGRSVNEASILIHLVLKNINYNSYHFREKQNGPNILQMFKCHSDCTNWELEFEKQYILPVMNDIDRSLEEFIGLLTVRDYNKLFGLVYKSSNGSGKCANDFLWRFHPTVTESHFVTNSISLSLREKNPLMFMFMSEQVPLKATKYLPDIVKFQQRIQSVIADNFAEVKKTIEEKTFLEFLEIAKIPDEVEIQNTFESLQKAWKMCYQHLLAYDRWNVADFDMCSITTDTKMKYLIPMTYDYGIITIALVDFLVNTHNSFVVHSRGYIVRLLGRDRYWNRKVSIANVYVDQLIDFEDNFLPVITAHSAQKFVGDGCKIRYNIDEIEKDLVLKTVVGKPLIVRVADIPKPIWQKGLDIKLVIERVKKHVPQRPLTHQAKAEIYKELKTVAIVTEVQYTIRTVLSFIRRNLNPKQKIVQFMNELKMTEPLRCAKIKDYCYLENVVALWKLLKVQYARICVNNNEDVFENAPGSIIDKLEADEHEDQKALLKKALEKMKKLEILIAVMFEFIEVQTATMIGQGETYSKVLRDELQEFIRQTNLEPVPHLEEFFPDVITVSQVVDTWKELVKFHDSNITK